MNLPYIITYTDHRGNLQRASCSSFEDAEAICRMLAGLYGMHEPLRLSDGQLYWLFRPEHLADPARPPDTGVALKPF